MDTSDPNIQFDGEGVCSNCWAYDFEVALAGVGDPRNPDRLRAKVRQMKQRGRRREYDCIVGLSGGVDSSYLAYTAVELGLRPLAIHLDNGWDSEVAVHNIERIVRGLDLDLVTHVIDWVEFRDLQRSFFAASVVDIELLTDHAITAFAVQEAKRRGIRFLLSGTNAVTEAGMPVAWTHRKSDERNIRAIHAAHGSVPMRTFPTAGTLWLRSQQYTRQVESVSVLNWLDYDKHAAIDTLERELGWEYYGGKHYESIFTRYYQAHILPHKFGIDKRRVHLSALVRAGRITRDAGLKELDEPLYEPRLLAEHRAFVQKKLGFSDADFDEYLASPPRPHLAYGSDERVIAPLMRAKALGRRVATGVRSVRAGGRPS